MLCLGDRSPEVHLFWNNGLRLPSPLLLRGSFFTLGCISRPSPGLANGARRGHVPPLDQARQSSQCSPPSRSHPQPENHFFHEPQFLVPPHDQRQLLDIPEPSPRSSPSQMAPPIGSG